MLPLQGCFATKTYGHSSNDISRSHERPKYLSHEANLLFENAQNFLEIAKMQ